MAKQNSKQTKLGRNIDSNSMKGPITSPGPAPAVSPSIARQVLAKKVINAKSIDEFKSRKSPPTVSFAAQSGLANNTVQTPVSTVAELARSLKDDVDLIFYHVYNNIEFHPTFGLQKSSVGCMIDGNGNAFDQCNLLVELLTEAGYTASFLYGELDLSQEEVSAWLGTDSTNIFNSTGLLSNGGIPNEAIWTGTEWRIDVSHVWVKVTIDSVDYILDPAFKEYSSTTGINLATAMDYDQSDFLDAADDGATIDTSGNWIEDVNAGNIATELETYTENLIDWIKTNNPDAKLNDIIGGRSIVQIDSPVRMTSHPNQKSGQTPTTWTSIPNSYRITVRFTFEGIDETLYGDELHGRRITLFYNGSNEGELRVDGTLIDTSSVATSGGWMEVTVTHPYGVTWYDQVVFIYLAGPSFSQQYHLIGANFGVSNQNLVEVHSKAYEANNYNGSSAIDEAVLGERLAIQWNNWVGQYFAVADILGRMTDGVATGHHLVGRCSMSDYSTVDAISFDIQGTRALVTSLSGDTAEAKKFGIAFAMHGYCLEMLAIQQLTGNDAYSATTLLEDANANGDKIYKGTSTNWTSDVTPNLTGYNSGDLSNIKTWYLDNGWHALISETAPIAQGPFDNTGWALIEPNGGALGVITSTFGGVGEDGEKIPCQCPEPYSFKYRTPGLLLGSSQSSLAIAPTYDSSSSIRYGTNSSGLGIGWTHNWEASAREVSAGFKRLGSNSTFDAVVSIVELFVHLDMLDDTDYPILNAVSGSLCNSWWADQLTGNAVVLQEGHSVMEFIRQPDGSYTPPSGDASVLVKNMDGSFTLTTKNQVVSSY